MTVSLTPTLAYQSGSSDMRHPVPVRLAHDDAVRIAGELFGNLFGRDSDKDGFDYALKALLSGEKSPRQLVLEFVTSEEFRELHMMNQTPNEFARRVQSRLLGIKRLNPRQIKDFAVQLLQDDWRSIMAAVVESPEYASVHGDRDIPVWV